MEHKKRKQVSDDDYNVIGYGGYGCVFEIGFENKVGKMNFGNKAMYTEHGTTLGEFMKIQADIFSIDPSEQYFITTTNVVKMQATDPIISHCLKIEARSGKPDRKQEYDVFIQTRVSPALDINEWNYEQVNHAINGLNLLHSRGFVHGDVHRNNFGFKNDLPVYIDMDSATHANHPRVNNRGTFFVDLNETAQKDFNQLKDVFKVARMRVGDDTV
jgi:hypothetical protein